LSVVPNPTSGNATLLVTLQDNADLTVSVYDMFGKFISNVDKGNFATGSNRISINTENLQSGVYFVNVAAGERNSAVKMVVAK
jgi:pectate lyase